MTLQYFRRNCRATNRIACNGRVESSLRLHSCNYSKLYGHANFNCLFFFQFSSDDVTKKSAEFERFFLQNAAACEHIFLTLRSRHVLLVLLRGVAVSLSYVTLPFQHTSSYYFALVCPACVSHHSTIPFSIRFSIFCCWQYLFLYYQMVFRFYLH